MSILWLGFKIEHFKFNIQNLNIRYVLRSTFMSGFNIHVWPLLFLSYVQRLCLASTFMSGFNVHVWSLLLLSYVQRSFPAIIAHVWPLLFLSYVQHSLITFITHAWPLLFISGFYVWFMFGVQRSCLAFINDVRRSSLMSGVHLFQSSFNSVPDHFAAPECLIIPWTARKIRKFVKYNMN